MLIEYLIGQLFLILYNVGNVYIDAYRIMKDKTIAHGLNLTVYLIFTFILCLVLQIRGVDMVLFFISAFFNRQFSFDIPLNLRRGLAWYYQSEDDPPKALLDRIERAIFGTGEQIGKKIFNAYLVCYCVITIAWIWIA